jgi:hypothetical protein
MRLLEMGSRAFFPVDEQEIHSAMCRAGFFSV